MENSPLSYSSLKTSTFLYLYHLLLSSFDPNSTTHLRFLSSHHKTTMEPFESAMNIILNWDSKPTEQSIFSLNRSEITQYLQAFDQIQQSLTSTNYHHIANDTISMAVTRLKHEFHNILTKRTMYDHGLIMGLSSMTESTSLTESYEYESQFYNYASENKHDKVIVNDLGCIVERMNSAGCLRSCLKAYKSIRKPFLDTSLKLLCIEEFGSSNAQRCLRENLKFKIEVWIRAAKRCVGFLFAREKQLFEQIFEALEEKNHECFRDMIIYGLIQLFNFPEALSRCRRAPEKLFKILDLYNVLTDLLPEVNVLLQFESLKTIQIDVISFQLEEMVRGILSDFEIAVGNESSNISDTKWAIHPLTKYVMDYLILITKYKKALDRIIISRPSQSFGSFSIPDKKFAQNEGLAPLSVHLILIIVALRFNLEEKSKYYKETTSLVPLFMMNNVQYIVQNIKGSPELREMIGEDYLKKLRKDVTQAVKMYQSLNCNKILYCLREDGLCGTNYVSSRVSKSAVRKRIKTFNAMLEEVQLNQETWGVPDLELREELRLSISGKLVPAYKYFLERFGNHIESRKNNYIKYLVEELQTLISTNFFPYCRGCISARKTSFL